MAAAPPILTLSDIALRFGARQIVEGAGFSVAQGDRLALVGRNGAGKSTLLRMAAGLVEPDRGSRFVQPGCRVVYLPQEPDLAGQPTLGAYVEAGLPAELAGESWRAAAALGRFDLEPGRGTEGLSGGEARRAAIARALAAEPDLLLLDEPTNHCDIAVVEQLEEVLAAWRGGLVLVSHDRAFLTRLAAGVLWLDRGIVRRMDGGYAGFDDWAAGILEREAVERAKRDKLIAAETVWSHQGISARRRRNQGRLRRLGELRAERRDELAQLGQARLASDQAESSGRLVIEAEGLAKAWGGQTILRDFSTRILRGDRIGIVGPNGAGKSTLIGLLTGEIAPDAGRLRHGAGLKPVIIDQRRARLTLDATPWSILCPGGGDSVIQGGRQRHVVGYLGDFLFEPAQAKSPVASLSGGERNRLLLAWALVQPGNLLVLDEPTNDLDLDTLDLLQELLADYDGTVLLVSHDRDFLDRTVTAIFGFAGDGRVVDYAGGWSDALAQGYHFPKPAAAAPSAPAPAPAPAAPKRAATRLTYKLQRELDDLPGRIEALGAEAVRLEAALADPAFYGRDPKGFAAAGQRLAAARAELAAAEDRWLELEAMRESLAAG